MRVGTESPLTTGSVVELTSEHSGTSSPESVQYGPEDWMSLHTTKFGDHYNRDYL